MSDVVIIYVCGPVTGRDEFNWPAFRSASRRLRDAGYAVRCPSESGAQREDMSSQQCLRAAVALLLECDAVALLPGWESSRVATVERDLALELGMVVRPLDRWLPCASTSEFLWVGTKTHSTRQGSFS